MTYIPGHSMLVAFAAETNAIAESTDGTTAATLGTLPSSPAIIGYTNIPELTDSYGNKKGFGGGVPHALYNARGPVAPQVKFEMTIVSRDFLKKCLRTSDGVYDLGSLCIFTGVNGQNPVAYRYAECSELVLNFTEGAQDAQELKATCTFMAIAKDYTPATPLSATLADLQALGSPLFWHDIRQFAINGTDYRSVLMGQTVTLNHNIERKGQRPNWGDDSALSRTNYQLLPHLVSLNGESTFHAGIPDSLFNGAKQAQNWGDIVIACSDAPGRASGSQVFNVTLKDVMPVTKTQRGGGVEQQVTYTVPIVASDLRIATS